MTIEQANAEKLTQLEARRAQLARDLAATNSELEITREAIATAKRENPAEVYLKAVYGRPVTA